VSRLAALGAALILGWRLPDLILNHLIRRRRLRLEHGMPDALDLLVVCAEAGLSLNQSIEEISRQLRPSNEDVADEFATTSAEMQVFADFAQALDNLVERTGLDTLRSLIATLKQSLKFGTALAESLRLIAAEMRAARHARIGERAARLPVLLAIPMDVYPALLGLDGPRRHQLCQTAVVCNATTKRSRPVTIIRIGLDTSKHVFHVHGVDGHEQPVLRRRLQRSQVEKFFAKLPPTRIGLEACGASHHWARVLRSLGPEAVLIPPQCIKPYVQ